MKPNPLPFIQQQPASSTSPPVLQTAADLPFPFPTPSPDLYAPSLPHLIHLTAMPPPTTDLCLLLSPLCQSQLTTGGKQLASVTAGSLPVSRPAHAGRSLPVGRGPGPARHDRLHLVNRARHIHHRDCPVCCHNHVILDAHAAERLQSLRGQGRGAGRGSRGDASLSEGAGSTGSIDSWTAAGE